jgi:hypothetical protein
MAAFLTAASRTSRVLIAGSPYYLTARVGVNGVSKKGARRWVPFFNRTLFSKTHIAVLPLAFSAVFALGIWCSRNVARLYFWWT